MSDELPPEVDAAFMAIHDAVDRLKQLCAVDPAALTFMVNVSVHVPEGDRGSNMLGYGGDGNVLQAMLRRQIGELIQAGVVPTVKIGVKPAPTAPVSRKGGPPPVC